MQQLSEQAQSLIDDFKKNLLALPVDERKVAMKRIIEDISTLNKETTKLFKTFYTSHKDSVDSHMKTRRDTNISEYL